MNERREGLGICEVAVVLAMVAALFVMVICGPDPRIIDGCGICGMLP